MIDAKPCLHNGYIMRSKCERAWARHLDSLRIDYLYEPEVWSTDAGAYLPDFFVPAADCFLEIKGSNPTGIEIRKAEGLMKASGKLVVFGVGAPQCTQFADGLLPSNAVIMAPGRGRWVTIPMTLIGQLVYSSMGMASGLRFAQAGGIGADEAVPSMAERMLQESKIAYAREPINALKRSNHRQITQGEAVAGQAAAYVRRTIA
jgi:hypothetical protein